MKPDLRVLCAVYKKSGLTSRDVDVIELHDCFSTVRAAPCCAVLFPCLAVWVPSQLRVSWRCLALQNELLTYEGLGLCKTGEAASLVDSGDCTYGGRWVVNPSGGLISKGHPLGATGLAQCAELCWQVRPSPRRTCARLCRTARDCLGCLNRLGCPIGPVFCCGLLDSLCGSCVARPASVRCPMPRWACSTT